jgi:hypothetical protein
MNATKNHLPGRGPQLNGHMESPWITLTDNDLARLGGHRQEIILVLRQWHGYGRIRANRAFSYWLNSHSPARIPPAQDSTQTNQDNPV